VKIIVDGKSFHRWHHGGAIFGQSIKPVHFGIGEATVIDEIEVRWLSGIVENYFDVDVNQKIYITEGSGLITSNRDQQNPSIIESSAFPNPFVEKTELIFHANQSGDLMVRIFDLTGQEVFTNRRSVVENEKVYISWEGNAVGAYFYIASLDGQQVQGKLIKQ